MGVVLERIVVEVPLIELCRNCPGQDRNGIVLDRIVAELSLAGLHCGGSFLDRIVVELSLTETRWSCPWQDPGGVVLVLVLNCFIAQLDFHWERGIHSQVKNSTRLSLQTTIIYTNATT